eukprot:s1416_g3.t1
MGKDWSHDGATPLAEVDVNASYTGTVTNVGQFGVFVNFGAVKDGLLKVPSKLGRRLKKGMQIEDLTITSLDPDAGKVVMEVDETQLQDLEPRPRSRGRSPAPKSRAKSPRPRARPKRTWNHPGATPLEELQEGDVFEGTVTNVSVYGVFVDLGAVRDARLNVPAAIGRKFRIGDVVQDCIIDKLDLEQGRMSVALPEEALAEAAKAKDSKATPKASAKAKAKAQVKAKAKAATQATRAPAEAPRVGSTSAKAKPRAKSLPRGGTTGGATASPARAQPKRAASAGPTRAPGGGKGAPVRERPERPAPKQRAAPARGTNGGTSGGATAAPARAQPKRASSGGPARPGGGKGAPARERLERPAAKQRAAAPTTRETTGGIPIEKLRVGLAVDGIVTNNNQYGVFVNIGCAKDARLNVNRQMAKEFRKGDEIYGMTIESVDLEKNQISCSLEDPELFVEEETAPSRRRK